MPKPWTIAESTVTFQDRWLKVRSDRCLTEAGKVIAPYHVLSFSPWINVVALNSARQIILVREYRHGAGVVLTGLPSGGMDAHDSTAEAAARRELREETGFTGGSFIELASNYANPANQDNMVHLFLAFGVEETDVPSLDHGEEIQIVREDYLDYMRRFWRGEILLQVSHTAALHAAAHSLMSGRFPLARELGADLRTEWLSQF